MSSLVRISANRANARKSRGPITPEGKRASARSSLRSTGPVTPEGKARVSRNALKHGLLAKSVVLPDECSEGFETAFMALCDELQPRTYLENECVEIMAVANWRRKRAWHMEMDRLTHAIRSQQSTADPENPEPPSIQTALAFGNLSERSNVLRTLHRYEVRLSREFIRHLKLYQAIRCQPFSSVAE